MAIWPWQNFFDFNSEERASPCNNIQQRGMSARFDLAELDLTPFVLSRLHRLRLHHLSQTEESPQQLGYALQDPRHFWGSWALGDADDADLLHGKATDIRQPQSHFDSAPVPTWLALSISNGSHKRGKPIFEHRRDTETEPVAPQLYSLLGA